MQHIGRPEVARYSAAVAFLAAVTIAALLIRSGITTSDRSSGTPTSPVGHVVRHKRVPPSERRYYVVRSGDTLAQIAFRFHTTVGELKRLNPHVRPTSLFIHHRLRVK